MATLLRVAIALQGVVFLDRLFLPDDTYYSLSIARHIAAGDGPTTDGMILTNGFQPLITFLQVPLFWLGSGLDQAVRWACCESALFGAAGVACLGLLVARAHSRRAGWFAALAAAFNPMLIKADVNGLETSLSGLVALLVVLLVPPAGARFGRAHQVGLGALLGLALLARIDLCFLVGIVGLVLLARRGVGQVLLPAIVAGIVVLPWWIYSYSVVGSFLPESGQAVRQIIGAQVRADGWLLQSSLLACAAIGQLVPVFSYVSAGNMAVGAVMLGGAAFYGVRRARAAQWRGNPLLILLAAGACQLLFYVFYLRAFWFFSRYLYLVALCVVAVGGVYGAGEWARLRAATAAGFRARAVFACVVAGGAMLACAARVASYFGQPAASFDSVAEGRKGYGEVAQAIMAHVPPGVVVGARQSGALGYYAPPGVRVVNLDGVVNGQAYRAMRDRRMADYITNTRMTYFADWQDSWGLVAGGFAAGRPVPGVKAVFMAMPQGDSRSGLYMIDR